MNSNYNLYQSYGTSENGLSDNQVKERTIKYGKNILPETKLTPFVIVFLRQYMDPMVYILLFASLISFIVGEIVDSLFILIVVTLNAIIGSIQEYSANKSASSLKKIMDIKTFVIRDGNKVEISAKDLTVGDVVVLEEGGKVPADIILIQSKNLKIDESMLTGESKPVLKNYTFISKEDSLIQDRLNEIFAGTIILKGNGIGIVRGIGISTEIGKIANKIMKKSDVKTPLVERMEDFTKKLTIIMGLLIIIIAIISFYSGMSFRETLIMSASLGVAAMPEGLSIAITICLAIGMNRMAKDNVIVKNLNAVEALGSCNIIATDKTGTLTKNELSVIEIIGTNNELFSIYDNKENNVDFQNEYEKNIFLSFILPNEANEKNNDFFGDPVDIAFLKAAKKKGLNIKEIKKQCKKIDLISYTSELKYSASLNLINDENYIFVKGAPETIINMCKMTEELKNNIYEKLNVLAQKGLRILSVAYKKEDNNIKRINEENLNNLDFLALVTMLDPLKDEVKESIKQCQKAGVKVVMITGDNPKTAFAIGNELGFVKNQNEILIGTDIKELLLKEKNELDKVIRRIKVFARIEPTQKLTIVESLRRGGNFVAVTGDGINDAPALKNSNVGVAMGKKGTDIARESANIILTDDNFTSIVKGIKIGRLTYSNIRKLIFLLISTSFVEIGLFLLSIICKIPLPFTPVQLLWINIITESIQGIAIAMEGEEGNEMTKKPRSPKESIFNKIMLFRILLTSFIMIGGCFGVYKYYLNNITLEESRSILMYLMILFQNIQIFNARSEDESLFKQKFSKNPFLFISISFVTLLHIVATYITYTSKFLKIFPITYLQLKIVLPVLSCIIIAMEFEKFVRKYYKYPLYYVYKFFHYIKMISIKN